MIGMKAKKCEDQTIENSELPIATICDEDTREIYLTGIVTMDMYQNTLIALKHLDRTKGAITLVINTQGGEAAAGMAIADAIKMAKSRVIAHCYGECMSIGMTILQACDTRLSTPTCRFMIHDVRSSMEDISFTNAKRYMEEFADMQTKVMDSLVASSGLTLNEIKHLCNQETFFSAEMAIAWGFLDGIFETLSAKAANVAKKPAKKARNASKQR
jgi:ATP-dependent protease ClpP protease subunit